MDGDGDIDSTDSALIQAHMKSVKILDDMAQKRADVNGNGSVDASDAAAVLAHVKAIKLIKQD